MNLSIVDILYEGILAKGRLHNNPIAYQIYQFVNQSKDLKFSDLLAMNPYKSVEDFDLQTDKRSIDEPNTVSDFRFLKLGVSGLRRFPLLEDNKLYSLDFSIKREGKIAPSSVIFLGNNGVGKTSLFNSLEYAFAPELPSIRFKDINDKSQYLRHVDNKGNFIINISTVQGITVSQLDSGLMNPCFVFSEADLYQLQQKCNITEYLYRQMGVFDDYIFIKTTLPNVINLCRTTYEVWAKSYSGTATQENKRKIFLKKIQGSSILSAYISLLEKYVDNNTVATLGMLLNQTKTVLSYLHSIFSKQINITFKNDIFPVLKDLFYEFKDDRSINVELTGLEFNIKMDGTQNMAPYAYLNAFRMMMLSLSLKIGLACAVSSLYDVNFPIIVDDVFNSSDFDNRERLEYYITSILDCAEKYSLIKNLQLIVFTQDALIAQSLYEGLRKHPSQPSVKQARIFDYHEVESLIDNGVLEMEEYAFGNDVCRCIPLQHDY